MSEKSGMSRSSSPQIVCEGCGAVKTVGWARWIRVARSEVYCPDCYEPVSSQDGDDA